MQLTLVSTVQCLDVLLRHVEVTPRREYVAKAEDGAKAEYVAKAGDGAKAEDVAKAGDGAKAEDVAKAAGFDKVTGSHFEAQFGILTAARI